jgi:spore coat protein U-like protein
MNHRLFFAVVASMTMGILPAAAVSATPVHTRTATLKIKGSVLTNCSLTTSDFTFTIGLGYIHAPKNTILKQGSLGVRCTKGAVVQIKMNAGLYGSAAGSQFGSRSMRDAGGDYLGYELCHDSACSAIWNNQGYSYTSGSDAGSSLPVWARILTAQPQVRQGNYSDSVTVTVNF